MRIESWGGREGGKEGSREREREWSYGCMRGGRGHRRD